MKLSSVNSNGEQSCERLEYHDDPLGEHADDHAEAGGLFVCGRTGCLHSDGTGDY